SFTYSSSTDTHTVIDFSDKITILKQDYSDFPNHQFASVSKNNLISSIYVSDDGYIYLNLYNNIDIPTSSRIFCTVTKSTFKSLMLEVVDVKKDYIPSENYVPLFIQSSSNLSIRSLTLASTTTLNIAYRDYYNVINNSSAGRFVYCPSNVFKEGDVIEGVVKGSYITIASVGGTTVNYPSNTTRDVAPNSTFKIVYISATECNLVVYNAGN